MCMLALPSGMLELVDLLCDSPMHKYVNGGQHNTIAVPTRTRRGA